jgi:dynein light chain Tctex-type 1
VEKYNGFIFKSIHQVFGIKENENTNVNIIYARDKVNTWTNQIIDYTIRGLSKLGKPFKYCCTCILQQNNGAGFIVTGTLNISTYPIAGAF